MKQAKIIVDVYKEKDEAVIIGFENMLKFEDLRRPSQSDGQF